MKVLLINGSPRQESNTLLALNEVAGALHAQGIETETVGLGLKPIRGCMACGACRHLENACIFEEDCVNEILEKAEGIKTGDVRLILQPMRNVPDLRAYLYENGFDITGEKLAREEERIYEIICAEYSGEKRTASKLLLLLGEKNIENKAQDKALFSAFCEKQAAALEKKIAGMRTGGADTGAEEELLRECRMQSAECRMQSAE